MRINQRKVTVKLIESDQVHNQRLLAEYFAKKFNERKMRNETI